RISSPPTPSPSACRAGRSGRAPPSRCSSSRSCSASSSPSCDSSASPRRMSRRTSWSRGSRSLFTLYLPVAPFVFFALFPLYFMLVTSLKKNAELYNVNAAPFLIRQGVTLGHYELLSKDTMFWSWFVNSLLASVAATVISVVLGILAAYSLARLRFLGADSFGVAIFITYLVPPSLLFLPLSTVVNRLGLSDSLWALIVTYPPFL